MPSIRRLAYRDAFVWALTQTMTGGSGTLSPFLFPDDTTPQKLTIEISQDEFTAILSALMTGADLSYPEMSHEVVWSFLRNLEYPPVAEQYGTMLDIWFHQWQASVGGAVTISAIGTQWFGYVVSQATPANGDILTTIDYTLAPGRYEYMYVYSTLSTSGIVNLRAHHIDGTIVTINAGIDQYTNPGLVNQRAQGSFTLTQPGNWAIERRISGKNASSSGFGANSTLLSIWRVD